MKKLYKFCLGKYLGENFKDSYVELYVYDWENEKDRKRFLKQMNGDPVPENGGCGVTDYGLWRSKKPTIKIYINTSIADPFEQAFCTIPHEIEHALGKGVLRKAAIELKMTTLYPGCEEIARVAGVLSYRFQLAYLKEIGYNVQKC